MNTDLATSLPIAQADAVVPHRRRPRRRRGSDTIRRHTKTLCPELGLIRFRDRGTAREALDGIRWSRGSDSMSYTGSRIFKCAHGPCNGGWHVGRRNWVDPIEPAAEPVVEERATERPRTCHLIDIENLVGAGGSPESIRRLWQLYRQQAVGFGPRDLVIVGVAARFAENVRTALEGERVNWVVGDDVPSGADAAMLAKIKIARIAKRYSRLVVASNDHAFRDVLVAARSLGMTVQLVTRGTATSRELAAAASVRTAIRSNREIAARATNLVAVAA